MNPSEPVNPELQAAADACANPKPETKPEVAVAPKIVGYCRECGKALDETTAHAALGAIFCQEHRPPAQAPDQMQAPPSTSAPPPLPQQPPSPYTVPSYHASQPPPLPATSPLSVSTSPGLAFVLGMIPGVGAVYNGQYAKGLLHVIIFGLAISAVSSGYFSGLDPVGGLFIACFWFYMAFEAYHTAKKRRAGMPVDEFSSVFPGYGPGHVAGNAGAARAPIGPLVLIALGVLFLLSNLQIIEMRKLMRYWPALLIVLGVYMIYVRLTVPREGRRDGQ